MTLRTITDDELKSFEQVLGPVVDSQYVDYKDMAAEGKTDADVLNQMIHQLLRAAAHGHEAPHHLMLMLAYTKLSYFKLRLKLEQSTNPN